MLRTGQAEFALILGLLVIASVVGIYSYSSITPPSVDQVALTEEQKGVAAFVNDFLKESALSTISNIYRNGGYSDVSEAPLGYVNAKGFGDVPYWQMCESHDIPDIISNFKEGIRQYIIANLPDTDTMGGRSVSFNKAAAVVDITVYDNNVMVSATIPTVVDGTQIPQPYRVEVPTNIGRISDYAGNFARMEADCRMLDNHLLFALMQSSEFSADWIPFGTGNANNRYSFTWDELRTRMEKYVRYSIAQTQIGRDIPITEDEKIASFIYSGWDGTAMEFFFVPGVLDYDTLPVTFKACQGQELPLGGELRTYDDLKMGFYPGFEYLTPETFSAPEILEIKPKTGSFMTYFSQVGLKAAEYSQAYSVRYPVIVTLMDEKTHEVMKFAVHVYMESNGVGTGCTANSAIGQVIQSQHADSYTDRCLEDATEPVDIEVLYTDGSAVQGAIVTYDGCLLGNTMNGVPVEKVDVAPRFYATLTVAVDGNEYSTCYNYAELNGLTVTIPKSENFRYYLNTVDIDVDGNTYTMSEPTTLSNKLVRIEMIRHDADVCDPRASEFMSNIIDGEFVPYFDITRLPIESYNVSVMTSGIGDYGTNEVVGLVTEPIFTPSSGSDIYIYAPVVDDFENVNEADIKLLYEHCNIDAIGNGMYSGDEFTGGSCTWTKS